MSESMSFEDAVKALDTAMEQDAQAGREPFDTSADPNQPFQPNQQTESKPEQSSPEGSATQPATPEPPASPVAPADSEPSFMERADLEALLTGVEDTAARERIEKAYKSFQAGFTQARQRESEIVKQYEQLGSAQELAQMAALRQQLQNPDNLMQLHAELSEYLGVQMPQAGVEEPQVTQIPDLSSIEDPDMEPLKQAFEGLRSELDSLRQEREAEQQALEAQRLHSALVGELQRQENIIRQNQPNYTDGDIDAVYELASFYDGNLLKAQERYEQITAARIEKYLAGKAAAVEATSPVPANPIQPPAPKPDGSGPSLDDAHKAALEALRHIEAQDS